MEIWTGSRGRARPSQRIGRGAADPRACAGDDPRASTSAAPACSTCRRARSRPSPKRAFTQTSRCTPVTRRRRACFGARAFAASGACGRVLGSMRFVCASRCPPLRRRVPRHPRDANTKRGVSIPGHEQRGSQTCRPTSDWMDGGCRTRSVDAASPSLRPDALSNIHHARA